mgnify:CR=1 FL=1
MKKGDVAVIGAGPAGVAAAMQLARYEARPFVHAMYRPVRLGRNLALDIADKVGPIKQVAMRHAMGIDADRPRLARGEPLAERKAGS